MQSTWITGSDLRIDAPIFTLDGRHLGVVKEIRRGTFKVDAPMARDYWLGCDTVMSADARRVTLDVDQAHVEGLKRGEPSEERMPDEHRAPDYDETWRGGGADYTGPDYLDAGRNWERSPREPDFSYAEWRRNLRPSGSANEWNEPREPFYRDSNPEGYREPRGSGWPDATYQDADRWSPRRDELRTPGRPSGYRGPAGRYSGQPVRGYDREVWDERPWSDSEAPSGYAGRGPRSYARPDDSIGDEVCERLTYAGNVDATHIDVKVRNGQVTLKGNVGDREQRRLAEDIACRVSGVRDIHNELRANRDPSPRDTDGSTYLV